MKRVNHARRGLAVIALLAVVVGLPALAGAEGHGARARVATHTGGVDFLPDVAYQKAVLTVSGNGQTHRYEFAPGEAMTAGVFDPEGNLLADGVYTWELRFTPDEATAARLRAQAEANGGEAPDAWTAQSGSFAIRGGLVADPDAAEEQALRKAAEARAPQAATGAANPLAADRPAAQDDDAAVGSRTDVEARLQAAAARQTPSAGSAGLTQPDRPAGDDSDAAAAALGRSLEPATTHNDQLSAQRRGTYAPRPRSDGSNGRPRSQ